MLGRFIAHCEDSLTVGVFGQLLHLPVRQWWTILRDATYTDRLPATPGLPEAIAFFPKWDASGTRNSSYVEPDVFLRFSDFDLIIEAKRWDEEMQDEEQWRAELLAYMNEFSDSKSPIIIIALGGIYSEAPSNVTCEWRRNPKDKTRRVTAPVFMCRWRGILRQCQLLRTETRRVHPHTAESLASARILDDVIDYFTWHGYSTGKWFGDFNFDSCWLPSEMRPHHDALQSITDRLNA